MSAPTPPVAAEAAKRELTFSHPDSPKYSATQIRQLKKTMKEQQLADQKRSDSVPAGHEPSTDELPTPRRVPTKGQLKDLTPMKTTEEPPATSASKGTTNDKRPLKLTADKVASSEKKNLRGRTTRSRARIPKKTSDAGQDQLISQRQ